MTDWTSGEMAQMYRQAHNKSKQIKILSELTCKSTNEIIRILESEGCVKPILLKCKRCGIEFASDTKRTKLCPECREINVKLSDLKSRLKFETDEEMRKKLIQKIKSLEEVKTDKERSEINV